MLPHHWGTCHGYRVLVADTGSCRDHVPPGAPLVPLWCGEKKFLIVFFRLLASKTVTGDTGNWLSEVNNYRDHKQAWAALAIDTVFPENRGGHFGSLSNGDHSNSLCREKGQLEQRTIPLRRNYKYCLPQVVPTGRNSLLVPAVVAMLLPS